MLGEWSGEVGGAGHCRCSDCNCARWEGERARVSCAGSCGDGGGTCDCGPGGTPCGGGRGTSCGGGRGTSCGGGGTSCGEGGRRASKRTGEERLDLRGGGVMETVANMHSQVATAAAARLGAALSDAQYFESGMVDPDAIIRQLESSSGKDKLEAMKRIIALISLGKDASRFFPSVVKNVVASSMDVRKLVYMYLVHYAEETPDLALLAINTLQKDLSNGNQLIRALALKVLSSIRVKTILQIVVLGINKSANDSSPYVRKTAANAIPKVYSLDPSSAESLLEPLSVLLGDRVGMVVGSAAAALQEVAPHRFDLLHPHFRHLCRALIDLDEWSQLVVLDTLLHYARKNFRKPSYQTCEEVRSGLRRPQEQDDRNGTNLPASVWTDEKPDAMPPAISTDADLDLLLTSSRVLFTSINSAVTLNLISLYFHAASVADFRTYALKPLIRLLRLDRSTQCLALESAVIVAKALPDDLAEYGGEFLVSAADGGPVRNLKMKVITTLLDGVSEQASASLHRLLLPSLKRYVFDPREDFASSSVRALGLIALSKPLQSSHFLRVLASVSVTSTSPSVVSASIAVIRRLLQRAPQDAHGTQHRQLAKLMTSSKISAPEAKANLVWLIGEFYDSLPKVAPEVLRRLCTTFPEESVVVKLQTLTLAAKLEARNRQGKLLQTSNSTQKQKPAVLIAYEDLQEDARPDDKDGTGGTIGATCHRLFRYAVEMGLRDRNYDVRDRARILQALFFDADPSQSSLLKTYCDALLQPKETQADYVVDEPFGQSSLADGMMLGSLSQALGRKAPHFRAIEAWTTVPSEPSLRETKEQRSASRFNPVEMDRGSVDANRWSQFALEDSDYDSDEESSSSDEEDEEDSSDADGENGTDVEKILDGTRTGRGEQVGVQGNDVKVRVVSEADDLFLDFENSAQVTPKTNTVADRTNGGEATLYDLLSSPSPSTSSIQASLSPWSEGAADLIQTLGGGGNSSAAPTKGTGHDHPLNWHRLVDNWNGYGLEIDYSFGRAAPIKGNNATTVHFRISNRSTTEVTGLTCIPSNVSGTIEMTPFPPIASIAPGHSKETTMTARVFTGRPETLALKIQTSAGSIKAELRPTTGEVLRPDSGLTMGQFTVLERQLGGSFANEALVALPTSKPFAWRAEVERKILHVVHMAPLAIPGNTSDALFLTAVVMGSEKPVLLSVRPQEKPPGHATVRISCEDLLLASNLIQLVRACLTTSR